MAAASTSPAKLATLGSGEYGCVIRPPVPCNPAKTEYADSASLDARPHVSKLFLKKGPGYTDKANEEFGAYQLIKERDPRGAFTVGIDAFCTPQFSPEYDERTIKSICNARPMFFGRQLVYEYGGTNLLMLLKENTVPFYTILESLTSIVNGLVVLSQEPALVHMDIKPENIVLNTDPGMPPTAKLIDFGLSGPVSEILKAELLSNAYEFYPPEWRALAYRLPAPETTAFKRLLRDFTGGKEKLEAQFLEMAQELVSKSRTPDLQAAYFGTDDCKKTIRDLFGTKLDVYSLGMTVAMLYIVLKHKGRESDANNATLNRDLQAWVQMASHGNAFKRYAPQRAAHVWEDIWTRYHAANSAALQMSAIPSTTQMYPPLPRSPGVGGSDSPTGLTSFGGKRRSKRSRSKTLRTLRRPKVARRRKSRSASKRRK